MKKTEKPKKIYVLIGQNDLFYHFHGNMMSTTPSFMIFYTDSFKKAKKFRSLKKATRRARFLTERGRDVFYVYEPVGEEGEDGFSLVDGTINDDIFEENRKTMEEIEEIIRRWKEKTQNESK